MVEERMRNAAAAVLSKMISNHELHSLSAFMLPFIAVIVLLQLTSNSSQIANLCVLYLQNKMALTIVHSTTPISNQFEMLYNCTFHRSPVFLLKQCKPERPEGDSRRISHCVEQPKRQQKLQ